VSQHIANRVAADIIQAFSNHVIGIEALQRQPGATESAALAVADNLEVKEQVTDKPDQVSEAQRRVIHRNHLPGQVLLQVVHQHQEMMVVVAVKAVVQAEHVDNDKTKIWSDVIL
jgi:predicted regulator of amino acid metabolism with ACT domain